MAHRDWRVDLNAAVAMVLSLKRFVEAKRETFTEYERHGATLSGTSDYVQTRQRPRNVRFDYHNRPASDAELAPSQKFRVTSYINDRIATQRYSSPEIPIGSRVMSRTTSAPSGRRSRKMVANVAGCRSFCTFRDCHTSIAFTPVGPQPNLAHIFRWIWD